MKNLISSPVKVQFSYFNYQKPKKKESYCNCGNKKYFKAFVCQKCRAVKRRRVMWPTKEELKILLKEESRTFISRKYKVSYMTVTNWERFYNFEKVVLTTFPKR